jgi:hypothetical protein
MSTNLAVRTFLMKYFAIKCNLKNLHKNRKQLSKKSEIFTEHSVYIVVVYFILKFWFFGIFGKKSQKIMPFFKIYFKKKYFAGPEKILSDFVHSNFKFFALVYDVSWTYQKISSGKSRYFEKNPFLCAEGEAKRVKFLYFT